ncbi:MAG TPA: ABC transporter ATP-binding protein [Parvularculaceae bacterium]|nr:ABC transporter ATP-binding protein [Parvularculaceae bacterium]HNS85318.1 ABC transporter ATP-binding protein [Parvularculaceae bacterium]
MIDFSVKNLTVERKGAALLRNVNFTAGAGEFIGVVGPNGAGKSTLLRALAGVISSDGAVTLGGAPVNLMTPRERARKIAYLPQSREIHWAMTAEAVVSLGRFAYGAPHRLAAVDAAAVEAALAAADCGSFRDRDASTLSGGELARIHLARALAAETPIIIADEPTAALDLKHAIAIVDLLNRKAAAGGLAIVALHDLDLARRFCTRIIVLNAGELVADAAPEAALTDQVAREVFEVARDARGWRLADQ